MTRTLVRRLVRLPAGLGIPTALALAVTLDVLERTLGARRQAAAPCPCPPYLEHVTDELHIRR